MHIKGRRLDFSLSDRAHITDASFPELGTSKAPEECLLKAISEEAMHANPDVVYIFNSRIN